MPTEITSRFPTDRIVIEQIARGNMAPARVTVAALKQGLPEGHVVVARWIKPQFSTHRGHIIRDPSDLIFVLQGYTEHHCRSLRFFFETRAPGNAGYRDLFE